MIEDFVLRLILAAIVGALAAIIWSLRIIYNLEKRVARIETHIDKLVHKLIKVSRKK